MCKRWGSCFVDSLCTVLNNHPSCDFVRGQPTLLFVFSNKTWIWKPCSWGHSPWRIPLSTDFCRDHIVERKETLWLGEKIAHSVKENTFHLWLLRSQSPPVYLCLWCQNPTLTTSVFRYAVYLWKSLSTSLQHDTIWFLGKADSSWMYNLCTVVFRKYTLCLWV